MHRSPSLLPVVHNVPTVERSSEPPRLGRRAATAAFLGFGLTALAGVALAAKALPRTWLKLAEDVVRSADALSRGLAEGQLSEAAWHEAMEAWMRGIDAEDLARAIDLDGLVAETPRSERGAVSVALPISADRVALDPAFHAELLVLRRGRGLPPQGHENLAVADYVLRGRFRVRHFDRIQEEPGHLVLRPAADRSLGPGEGTTMSDRQSNVGWHAAETDGVVLHLSRAVGDAGRTPRTRYVDPVRAEALDGGLLRAPLLHSREDALVRFG